MGLTLEYKDGQTPLSEEDKKGLLIMTITTQGELDEFEQLNIIKAMKWTMGKKVGVEKLLSEDFLKLLHRKMYGEVWKWAGDFRITETNIGVSSHWIGIELKKLVGDVKYWIENEVYAPPELALRFKHKLVSIHCFSNGNGRHSRLMADLIMEKLYGKDYFNWGGSKLVKQDELRKQYIDALQEADNGNIEDLIVFAQS